MQIMQIIFYRWLGRYSTCLLKSHTCKTMQVGRKHGQRRVLTGGECMSPRTPEAIWQDVCLVEWPERLGDQLVNEAESD